MSSKKSQSDAKQKTLFDFMTFSIPKVSDNNKNNPLTIQKRSYDEMSNSKPPSEQEKSTPAKAANNMQSNLSTDKSKNRKIIEDTMDEDEPIFHHRNIKEPLQTPSFNQVKQHHEAQLKSTNDNQPNSKDLLHTIQSYSLENQLKNSNGKFRYSAINFKYPSLINQSDAKENKEFVDFFDNTNDDNDNLETSTPIKNTKNTQPQRNKCRTSVNNKPKKGGRKVNKSIDGSDNDNLSVVSNEEGLEMAELFANPQKVLPSFLHTANIKDKNGYTPDDQEYDPTTLFIPKAFYDKETPTMKQYWDFKRDNFATVLLMKLGKFYELFYDDAIVGNHVLDLNFMGSDPNKLHVGFPEAILKPKSSQLVKAGYQVAVVEQTETPEALEARNKTLTKKEKCVKRELCNVFTRGTFLQNEGTPNENARNQYCLCLYYNQRKKHGQSQEQTQIPLDSTQISQDFFACDSQSMVSTQIEWGITLFDLTTLDFYLGIITEEENMTGSCKSVMDSFPNLKTFLYNISPEEIIVQRKNIPLQVINFIHSLSNKPQVTTINFDYQLSALNVLASKYYGNDFEAWNNVILTTITNEESNRSSCISLYITMSYLEKILLAKECLPTANYHFYQANTILNPKKRLILDYQTVTNLELTETRMNPTNPEIGSLMEYMNKAVTPFGKRLMRNWILNPLYDITMINDRLDMIEDLMNNDELLTSFRNTLGKWPDIERQCSKFYKLAMNNNENAVYYSDLNKRRITEFFNLVTFMIKSVNLFDMFKDYVKKDKIKSSLQWKLIISDEEGNVPDIKKVLEEIIDDFKVVESKDEKGTTVTTIESNEGVSPLYDEKRNEYNQIKRKFDDILLKERKKNKCAIISYVHTKNFKYELDIPEDYTKDIRSEDYIFTTAKKGHKRYHTREILDTVNELDSAAEAVKQAGHKLNVLLFKRFYMKHKIINEYINNVAELDCLATLASISSVGTEINKTACRPKFISLEENNNLPYLEIRNCRHPCLCTRINYFVPNDIIIGSNEKTLIVITGPNMGGKSTLLREASIAIIMAQVGCYVHASKCIMTPVDRIFTRIGARDMLLEGKSTFYIEMEETKNIIQNATINSMVIMDELGRGTSTHDGKLIAKTIIDRLEKGIKCRTLFTTHYHDIIDWCGIQPGIDLFFMDCNVDLETKNILFKYLFRRGICPESYGISVAKLARLPKSIIEMATQISEKNRINSHA